MEICFNGKIYFISRLNEETDQQLINRAWWIMHNLEEDNYKEIVLLSKYWHNIVYKKCKYLPEIMNKILDFKYC
jgi:hypothetical protein